MLNLIAGMVHFALVLCHIYLQGTVKTYSAHTLECQYFIGAFPASFFVCC